MSIIFREYDRKVFCLCHTTPIRTGFGEEDIFENSRTYMYNYTWINTSENGMEVNNEKYTTKWFGATV